MSTFWSNVYLKRFVHTCNVLSKEVPRNLKGKKHSSQLWLQRQLSDPYVEKAKQEKYRCRSAFKLLEINERFKIFKPGHVVIDCGAAPGSWTQVAVKLTNADGKDVTSSIGRVIAIDKLPIYPIEGATVLGNKDFTTVETQKMVRDFLNNDKVDIVISDMAPNASGVRDIDHDNIIKLAYAALQFAIQVSQIDGILVTKLWNGSRQARIEEDILRFYKYLKIVRPNATRTESAEVFILAKGFKGLKNTSSTA